MRIKFSKYHGSGNDFVIIDESKKALILDEEKPAFVERISDRHFGIGSDGVIFVQKSGKADLKFRFFNPDGSIAEMCGNGIRCFAKYVYDRGLLKKEKMLVETASGLVEPKLAVHDGKVDLVTVRMGKPRLKRKDIPAAGDPGSRMVQERIKIKGTEYTITAVGMGNPHAVILVKDVESEDVLEHGRKIRYHTELFPKGANVHFIQKTGSNEFKVRSYERGVENETLACGTGICASAVAAVLTGEADLLHPITFHAIGGDLNVELESEKGSITNVYLTGPAVEVFNGEIDY